MGKNKKQRNRKSGAETVTSTQVKQTRITSTPSSLNLLLMAIVAALAIFLYIGSAGHDYAYDDLAVLKENRFVQKGMDGISDILNTQYFEGYDPNTNARAYRPVSLITYALEYEYAGLNPRVHHTVNILLYALTAVILLLCMLKLFNRFHWALAFLTTVFFVVHPVHVDVVANIKSRDELLGFLNFTIALLFLLKDLERPAVWKKAVSLFFYFLALASKESLLTTLACIPLVLYFFRVMNWSRIIRVSLPYAGVFVLFLLIRHSVISGAVENSSPITYLDNPILAATNASERIGTNIYTMGMYVQTLLFPYKLSCDYSFNSIPLKGIGDPIVLLYLLVFLFLGYVAYKGFRTKNIFSFCILWFLVTISIVSSIFIMSSNAYADRFLYTPSLAVCIAAAYAIYRLGGIAHGHPLFAQWSTKKIIASSLVLVIVIAATFKTVSYVPVWKDDLTLFAYNLKVNPQNARMHKNYGGEMVRQAMAMRSDTSLQKSSDTTTINRLARYGIVELEKAKAIYPGDAVAYIHEANAYILLGNFTEAEKNLRSALAIDYNNRFGNMSLGYVLYTTGRYKEAAEYWERISPEIRNQSDNYNLYLAYFMLGDQSRAEYYKRLSGR
jgi:hypothetical protein